MQQRISTRISMSTQTGHLLAARRKALKLSQKVVAARLGISQNRLSVIEADPSRLTLDRLISLAGMLGFELVLQDKDSSPTRSEW